MSSDLCDNISGRHVTYLTDTRRVINEQRYNKFFSDSIRICNQFEKVHPSVSLANRISRLGDRLCRNETISSSKKGREDCSDVSVCNGRQFDFKGFEKVTGGIDFHNLSNFNTKHQSVSFSRYKYRPWGKYDQRICHYSGPSGQRGAVMVDNQHENLPWKISLNITLRPNHIFRCIEEGLGCFMPWGFHEGLWSLVEKFWHTNVLELKAVRLAFLSFTELIKLSSIHLQIDNMAPLSYLPAMGGIQNKL